MAYRVQMGKAALSQAMPVRAGSFLLRARQKVMNHKTVKGMMKRPDSTVVPISYDL